jgi:two-component system CheB/CheR fusion protein
MTNLLNSMQVATIFLDTDLRVERYTEQAREIVRLIGSDLGRPLSDLTTSLRYSEIIDDARRVLGSLVPVEREVRDEAGRWRLVRIMPYRTAENVIDGLVITVVDIDRARQAEAEARAGAELFESIVQTVRGPLLVLDAELRIVLANEAFHRSFETSPQETRGAVLYSLDGGQWDVPELRRLLEEILPEDQVMSDFRVERDFPRVGRRAFLLNARRLRRSEEQPDLILLAFEDVTERP